MLPEAMFVRVNNSPDTPRGARNKQQQSEYKWKYPLNTQLPTGRLYDPLSFPCFIYVLGFDMWHYFCAHTVFHVTRWFPRNNRVKIRILLLIFTIGMLIPQFYVLMRPHTVRYCGQHLFELLIVSIVISFCMIGFSFLFSLMDPVPWEVKLTFHVFGVVCFLYSFVLAGFTSVAEDCRNNTMELYYMSLVGAFLCVAAAVFILFMLPFWIGNRLWKNCALDLYSRAGVCYEPVNCCSCVWHI